MAYYEQRQRAESFGQVAQNYDAFRPQYPEALASIHRSRLKLHAGLDFGVWAGSGQEGSPGLATRRVPLQILVSRRCWLVGQATA